MKRARVTEENAYGTALDRLTGADKPAQTIPEKVVPEQPATTMIKLSVFLNRHEDAYLENLASIAKFSGGKKISKTKLVEAMVRAFSTTGLDVRGVNTDEELFERVTAQLRK
jgi:hypothetical protein